MEIWHSVIFKVVDTLKGVPYYLVSEKQIVKFNKQEKWPISTESMTGLTKTCRGVEADGEALQKSEEITYGTEGSSVTSKQKP